MLGSATSRGGVSGCLVRPADPWGKRGAHRSPSSLNFSGWLWSFLCLVRRRRSEPGKKKPQPAGAPKLRDPATVNSDAAPRAAGEGRAEGQGRGLQAAGRGAAGSQRRQSPSTPHRPGEQGAGYCEDAPRGERGGHDRRRDWLGSVQPWGSEDCGCVLDGASESAGGRSCPQSRAEQPQEPDAAAQACGRHRGCSAEGWGGSAPLSAVEAYPPWAHLPMVHAAGQP